MNIHPRTVCTGVNFNLVVQAASGKLVSRIFLHNITFDWANFATSCILRNWIHSSKHSLHAFQILLESQQNFIWQCMTKNLSEKENLKDVAILQSSDRQIILGPEEFVFAECSQWLCMQHAVQCIHSHWLHSAKTNSSGPKPFFVFNAAVNSGSTRQGMGTPKGGCANLIFWPIFLEYYVKKKENRTLGCGRGGMFLVPLR